MVDVVDKLTRSRMMSGIRSKNTKPEVTIRKELFSRGYRYRIHDKLLPGKPDIVFPKKKKAVFVHGCFWHKHGCHLFKWPATRSDFWKAKIGGNYKKDCENNAMLKNDGWNVLIIWECALKGKYRRPIEEIIDIATNWIDSSDENSEITCRGSL